MLFCSETVGAAPAATDDVNQALQFECWTVADARRLARPLADRKAGIAAGSTGGPRPGSARLAPCHLGWEMGVAAAGRVPVSAWMLAVIALAEHDCIASA